MKSALIFLNGYYDLRYLEFYKQEMEWGLENNSSLICTDGGIRLFHALNETHGTQFVPDVLIGDLDSCEVSTEELVASGMHIVSEWVGKVDKDYTDGQLAVAYAIEECNAGGIIVYGGLPQPDGYETDHFLGNLKLMRFGLHVVQKNANANSGSTHPWKAEMRDALQTIYLVVSELSLVRKNEGLQRVSLFAEHANTRVENSENLRWNLAGLCIDPDVTNALRNELVQDANSATIRLAKDSDPVYVIHNWYDMQRTHA